MNRPVAVKVLTEDAEGMSRYQRELEITVRLGRAHPNIVTVLDTQVLPDGRPCIVMEYYELGSLQDQLRAHGPLPSSAVVAAGTVVADALGFAHREGLLHRDVKPQNILVLPTSYVLADFGLARRIDAGHTSSLERFSYRHASPQVLDGELPTVADDIYSLGSTLFTLLDGRPPFAVDEPNSDSALAYLRRARSELPRPIRSSDATPELLAKLLRDQLDVYRDHGASWALWTYKDIGLQGLAYARPESAYLRHVRPILETKARLGVDAWAGRDTGVRDLLDPIESLVDREFPEYQPWPWGRKQHIALLVRHILLAEPLAERYGELFRGVTAEHARELARSFRLENCEVRTRLAEVLTDAAGLTAGRGLTGQDPAGQRESDRLVGSWTASGRWTRRSAWARRCRTSGPHGWSATDRSRTSGTVPSPICWRASIPATVAHPCCTKAASTEGRGWRARGPSAPRCWVGSCRPWLATRSCSSPTGSATTDCCRTR